MRRASRSRALRRTTRRRSPRSCSRSVASRTRSASSWACTSARRRSITAMSPSSLATSAPRRATSPASPRSRARAWPARLRRSFSLCAPESAGASSAAATAASAAAVRASLQARVMGRRGPGARRSYQRLRAIPGGGLQPRARDCGRALPPHGEPAPPDGALPDAALAAVPGTPLGVYVHVPFCAAICGYCDFNRVVPGGGGDLAAYVRAALAEVRLARRVLGGGAPAVQTVFFGGGTPTLLPVDLLAAILDEIRAGFGLAAGAEVTVECNPETAEPGMLRALRAAGFTRISLGMQSAHGHVLATLDRRHTAGRAVAAAAQARDAGFEHVSLDLIYGTPGESDADWEASLAAALGAAVDHLSAYGLTVERGTRLHARVRAGTLRAPDDDAMARRYRTADALLAGAGLAWYEISNWAADAGARCRHNLAYWRSESWWGVGPGAHSHVGGGRWWNVLRPPAYAERLARGVSPAAGRERLTAAERRTERVMLGLRLAEGLALGDGDERAAAEDEAAVGRLDPDALARDGRAVLTLDGRLMSNAVARALVG